MKVGQLAREQHSWASEYESVVGGEVYSWLGDSRAIFTSSSRAC